MAGSQHVLPIAHPLVTGTSHVLSAMTLTDVDEYCPETFDRASIKETVKQFESLGMIVGGYTVDGAFLDSFINQQHELALEDCYKWHVCPIWV